MNALRNVKRETFLGGAVSASEFGSACLAGRVAMVSTLEMVSVGSMARTR